MTDLLVPFCAKPDLLLNKTQGEAKIWRMKNRTKRLNPKKDRKYKDGSSSASSSKMGLTTSNANL
jgi:hypothetical protein